MLTRLVTLGLLVILALPDGSSAAEPQPVVEFRMKSLVDLSEPLSYFLKISGQEATAKQVPDLIKLFANQDKGFEGINLNKPFGAYVPVPDAQDKIPAVVMIPVLDEAMFLNFLEKKAGLKVEKTGDFHTLTIPGFPMPILLGFHEGYVYASLDSKKFASKEHVILAKTFFAGKLEKTAELKVNMALFPEDLRKSALSMLELSTQALFDLTTADKGEKLAGLFAQDLLGEITKVFLMDGKQVIFSLDINPAKEDFVLELVLTPRSGTLMNKTFLTWKDRPSVAAGLGSEKNAPAAFGINLALPKGTQEKLSKLYDDLTEFALEDAVGDERDFKSDLLGMIAPTIKKGSFELGLNVLSLGTDKYSINMALATTQGNLIPKTLKKFAPFIPESEAKLTFDVEKANGLDLHNLLAENVSLQAETNLGKEVWLGTSDTFLAASWSKDSSLLKSLGKAKAAPQPMLNLDFSVVELMVANGDDRKREIAQKVFGQSIVGRDRVSLTLSGGNELKAKVVLKGGALQYAVAMSQAKK